MVLAFCGPSSSYNFQGQSASHTAFTYGGAGPLDCTHTHVYLLQLSWDLLGHRVLFVYLFLGFVCFGALCVCVCVCTPACVCMFVYVIGPVQSVFLLAKDMLKCLSKFLKTLGLVISRFSS